MHQMSAKKIRPDWSHRYQLPTSRLLINWGGQTNFGSLTERNDKQRDILGGPHDHYKWRATGPVLAQTSRSLYQVAVGTVREPFLTD